MAAAVPNSMAEVSFKDPPKAPKAVRAPSTTYTSVVIAFLLSWTAQTAVNRRSISVAR
jgi:hypothetical protein